MSGSNEKKQLTRRQERAISAMLSSATIKEAAKKCGVGESSLRRWLSHSKPFQKALADAQRQLTDAMFARLSALGSDAILTLERNFKSGAAGVETRAALGVLSLVLRRVESQRYANMEKEIERLSEVLEQRETKL